MSDRKICGKCYTVNGCNCLPEENKKGKELRTSLQVWTYHSSPRGATRVKFKKTILENGFEIPSGYEFWFEPTACFVNGTTYEVLFPNSSLNRVIKDINHKRLKGVL